jgi:guanosine-3',5'-bis(diphosphate) 3'-pyrophosphohydrolase
LHSNIELFYQIAIKNIDLKELKEFKVMGERLEAPKPAVKKLDPKPEYNAGCAA